MSRYELLIDEINGRIHAAVMQKTTLQALYIDPPEPSGAWASIYLGKIIKTDKKLNARIIDLGGGRHGLLPDKNALSSDLMNGQMIFVQIKAEGKSSSLLENHKLPRLTMKLHIMGHALYYTPFSSELHNAEVSAWAADFLKGKGGWVLREAARNADQEKIKEEAAMLIQSWKEMEAAAASSLLPGLLRNGPSALEHALGDYGLFSFDHVYTGNKSLLNDVIAWSNTFEPRFSDSKRLRLFRPEKPQQNLFDIYDLYAVLDELKEPVVALPNGGSVVIETTTALTVVDVNQGAADNTQSCNFEAASLITRQLRLRNISGGIIIDFINMTSKSDRMRLLDYIQSALAADPVPVQCHGFTRLGLIEITRKRRQASYGESLSLNT